MALRMSNSELEKDVRELKRKVQRVSLSNLNSLTTKLHGIG